MKTENLKKLCLEDGDILLHQANYPHESETLIKVLQSLHPDKRILVITNYTHDDTLKSIDDDTLLKINSIVCQQINKRGLAQ
jgi:hypothetical protein